MKKIASSLVLGCWLVVGSLGLVSFTGCGPGGTPAPPEDVAEPDLEESEEWQEMETETVE